MAESKVGNTAVADRTGIADHTGLAVGLQRSVRAIERSDGGRHAARAVVRGQQNLCRTRILEFDEVGFVLDVERRVETSGQWRIGGAHLYAHPANLRVCQEAAPEQRMVLGF